MSPERKGKRSERYFSGRFIVFLILSSSLLLLASHPTLLAFQEASTVRIIQVDGTVEVKKADAQEWSAAKEGDEFGRGDTLQCPEDSSAVLKWSNGSIVKVYPDTTLSLGGVVFELDKKVEKTILHLEKGRIFAKGQVPEHIFCHFEIRMGTLSVFTQGAEFALKYDEAEKAFMTYSLIGRTVTEVAVGKGKNLIRVEEGNQATLKEGQNLENEEALQNFIKENITPLSDKVKKTLTDTSKELGGSLLIEDEGTDIGGKLAVKIGGVRNRRGSAPYKVKFKGLIRGGSGKIKSIKWNFGDGEGAEGKEAEHSFTQGVYVVILRIEDENGEKTSAQINISAEEECAC